jgi:hypothetical protein
MVLINSFSYGIDNDKKASICITNANPIITMNLDGNELEIVFANGLSNKYIFVGKAYAEDVYLDIRRDLSLRLSNN